MRTLMTSGGLTRGPGMTERQRVIKLLSMPACAEMNHDMLELTGLSYSKAAQKKDMTKSRQAQDMKDTRTLLLALAEGNPFTTHTHLINIMTGIHVNVEKAREVGQSIMDSMTGKAAAENPFTKSKQAITFSAKSSIKVDEEKIQVDSQLFFQHLIIASQSLDDMSAIFKYVVCCKSQHWQMLSRISFLQMQLNQNVKYNMSWMVVHSFIGSLGLEDSQYIGRYVTCIISM